MRFLTVSGLYAPDLFGGAEYSSHNLDSWLLAHGHEVGVLTTARTKKDVLDGQFFDNRRIWRVHMPRLYQVHRTGKAWQKPIWHLQDHLDPSNQKIAAHVLDTFKPDFVNLHILQGLGLNIIKEVAKRNIPALYFQHDMGLVCLKRSMFVNGKDCPSQCALCKASSRYQEMLLKKIPRLTICSPSQANLDRIAKYFPLSDFISKATLNANAFPAPTITKKETKMPQLLYVGRIDHTKGVDILLKACKNLSEKFNFSLTIVGGGPEEKGLRKMYQDYPWVSFTGTVPQAEVSNFMINADILCFPSIWAEPLGGVALHALTLGIPVLGSNKGGIPELIEHDRNGLLIEAGNKGAWEQALRSVFEKPENVTRWRNYALETAHRFSQDHLAKAIYAIIEETMQRPAKNT